MADGKILIDSKIGTDGVQKGAIAIKKELNGISKTATKAGNAITEALSGGNVSNAVTNAALKVKSLERQLAAVSEKLKNALAEDDDKAAERLGDRQIALYDRLEIAREKLASEVERAAQKQTQAEQKEAEKQERIAKRQIKSTASQQTALSKSMNRFGVRMRGIIGSALVFNIISAGLRSMTDYFGRALMANDDFAKALSQLKGALLTAFQPIYNAVAPALTYLVKLATTAVQAIALLFATLTGTSLEESAKAAKNLYDQAGGYKAAGAAAKKAAKQIAAFDEIQKISNDASSGGGGGGSSGSNMPSFEFEALPKELEAIIEKLAFDIQEILFDFSDWKPGDIVKKIVAGLTGLGGAAIGFAVGGPAGAAIGALIGLGITFFITSTVPDEEWAAIEQSFSGFFGTIEAWLTGDWEGLINNFDKAWEGFLTADFWSSENSLGSWLLNLVGVDYQAIRDKLLGYIGEGGSMWDLFDTEMGGFLSAFFGVPESVNRDRKRPTGPGSKGARDVLGIGDKYKNRGGAGGPIGKAIEDTKTELEEFGVWVDNYEPVVIPAPTMSTNDWTVADAQMTTQALTQLWNDYVVWYNQANTDMTEWLKGVWDGISGWFNDNIITPLVTYWETAWNAITTTAQTVYNAVTGVFSTLSQFFSDTFSAAWGTVVDVFSSGGEIFTDIKDGILSSFKEIVNKLITGINNVVEKPFSGINSALRSIKGIDILGLKPFSGIKTISVPKIPYLAQGAVLPANKPFMAVVGDQRHGTNVEAPLTTIQEAVANVMDGQTSAILAGFEMSIGVQREILAAVLGIHIGDDAIVQAVSRYNAKMAVVRGY